MSSKNKRLKIFEKIDIIAELSKLKPPSKCSLARKFGVTEAAIRKVQNLRDEIKNRSTDLSEEQRVKKMRFSIGRYAAFD